MKLVIGKTVFNSIKLFLLLAIIIGILIGGYTLSETYVVNAQDNEVDTTDVTVTSFTDDENYVIFTKDDCEFCDEIKAELNKIGVSNVEYLNVTTSKDNETAFVNLLNKCGLENGAVPMAYIDENCVSGSANLLLVIELKEGAIKANGDVEAFVTAADVIITTILPEDWAVHPEAMNVSDYIIFGFFFILLVITLVFAFRANYTRNEKLRMISVIVGFVLILGLAGYLGFRVNQAGSLGNFLSSAGKKKAADCISTNSCRDWNARMDAQAQRAKDAGNKSDVAKFESKKVDQAALDAQLNAIAAACQANPACKASLDTSGAKATGVIQVHVVLIQIVLHVFKQLKSIRRSYMVLMLREML
jgi:glutaredoxin